MAIRIVMAEDHQIVRQGFKALLEQDGFEVVGEAGDGHEAVRLIEKLKPDVAIVDIAMPLLNGIDVAREVPRVSPDTRTILLTMHTDSSYILEALRAGVTGYLVKTRAVEDLTKAIREVCRGAVYLSSNVSREAVDAYLANGDVDPNPLTARERQVLQLVAEGHTSKAIAAKLELSVKTVESYRARVMEKVGVHETAGLVRYAIRNGVIVP
jgi:DNA-binding NarL/FixJ family response regulator